MPTGPAATRATTWGAAAPGVQAFYEHFDDLDSCFIALNALLREVSVARAPRRSPRPSHDPVTAVLDAYVAHLASSPPLLGAYLDHIPATGPAGVAFDREGNRQMAELIAGFAAAARRTP